MIIQLWYVLFLDRLIIMIDARTKSTSFLGEYRENGCDRKNILRHMIKRKIRILSIRCKYAAGGHENCLGKVSRRLNQEMNR